ncbi:MAG: hypothetical protein WB784_10480 [Rhodanobacteraceae bacterium]
MNTIRYGAVFAWCPALTLAGDCVVAGAPAPDYPYDSYAVGRVIVYPASEGIFCSGFEAAP